METLLGIPIQEIMFKYTCLINNLWNIFCYKYSVYCIPRSRSFSMCVKLTISDLSSISLLSTRPIWRMMYTFKHRPAHFPLFWRAHTLGRPASISKPLPHRCRPHVGSTNGIDSVNQTYHSVIYIQDIPPPPTLPSYFCRPRPRAIVLQ